MKLIVANWKMHLGPHEASLLVHKLNDKLKASKAVEVVICPPFIDLYPMSTEIDKGKIKLGSQNAHYLDEGPFTGEVSPAMLKGLAEYAIIGHSERRAMGEDDKLVAKKLAACLRNKITPILCIGDNLVDKEHGVGERAVIAQLTAALSMLTADEVEKVVITYEPVWAISKGDGHGNFAKPDDVEKMVAAMRKSIEELYGENVGQSVRIIYGGSVNASDATAYLKLEGIEGLLVGGASLNYEEFTNIVAKASAK